MSRNSQDASGNLPPSKAEKLEYPWALAWILALSLGIKLNLLGWNEGEYTDGIIQLTLWQSPIVFFPPGYTVFTTVFEWVMGDAVRAGRAASVFASTATLAIIYRMAVTILGDRRQALWAVGFLALSPVFNRWSLRVMSDSLFCLAFVGCAGEWMRVRRDGRRTVQGLAALCGLATLVRYQGLFFVPFIFAAWVKKKRLGESRNPYSLQTLIGGMLAAIPWVSLAAWIGLRGFGHPQQFAERAAMGWTTTLIAYGTSFETYLLYFPWAITYGLAFCGITGCIRLWMGNCEERRFMRLFAVAALVFLIIHSAFLSFQYRYLLPLVPLWCVAAARGHAYWIERIRNTKFKNIFSAAVLLNLALMTTAVLYGQRATFGDLVESAKYLREVGLSSRVLSDETYGAHATNIKMKFWSGRRIETLGNTEPHAGDLVVLHNAYTPNLEEAYRQLQERFEVVILRRWSAATDPGRFITLPLLPDIMVNPPIPLTSNPECMAFRFAPQAYVSVIFKLNEKR